MIEDDLLTEFNPQLQLRRIKEGGFIKYFFYLMSKLKTNHDKKYFAINIFNSII